MFMYMYSEYTNSYFKNTILRVIKDNILDNRYIYKYLWPARRKKLELVKRKISEGGNAAKRLFRRNKPSGNPLKAIFYFIIIIKEYSRYFGYLEAIKYYFNN